MARRAWAPGAAFLVAVRLKESGTDPGLLEPEAWALGGGWSHSVILGTGVLDVNFLMRQQPPTGCRQRGGGVCLVRGVPAQPASGLGRFVKSRRQSCDNSQGELGLWGNRGVWDSSPSLLR